MAHYRLSVLSSVLLISSIIIPSYASKGPLSMPTAADATDSLQINGAKIGGVFARTLQEAAHHWSTEHHDNRNSGNSGAIGPGEASGVCKTTVSIFLVNQHHKL